MEIESTESQSQESVSSQEHFSIFIRIMKYFSNKALFVFTLIFSVMLGAVPFIFYLIMGDMINIISQKDDFLEQFHKVLIKIIVFIIIQNMVLAVCTQLRSLAIPYFMRDLRRNLFKRY